MSILAASLVLMALGALGAAPIVAWVQGPLLRRVRSLEPPSRARWALALLAAPWAVGAALVAVTLGHCVVPGWFGHVDDCVAGVGLCVWDGAPIGRATIALAALLALRPLHALARAARGALSARRAAQRLRAVGAASARHPGWSVPGSLAAMIGFPKAELFVGSKLDAALSDDELAAMIEHERSHQAHGDLYRRLAARVLSSAHFDASGAELLAELDLALELRCDAQATQRVRDPLVVARALVHAATVQAHDDPRGDGRAPATLPARVQALVAPAWAPQPALTVGAAAMLTLACGASIVLAHRVHTAAEGLLSALARM